MGLFSASANVDRAQKKTSFAERAQEKGPIVGQYWVRFRVFYMTFRIMGNMPYVMTEGTVLRLKYLY